jgi:hypothetical protein
MQECGPLSGLLHSEPLRPQNRASRGSDENHTTRTVPVPEFVARLLATEMADRDGDELVFESARGDGYLTLGAVRLPGVCRRL